MSDNGLRLFRNGTFTVPGQCSPRSNKHNYLYCSHCRIRIFERCSINSCSCNGNGYIFRTMVRNRVFHQKIGESSSVAVWLNKPGVARRLINERTRRFLAAEIEFLQALNLGNGDSDFEESEI